MKKSKIRIWHILVCLLAIGGIYIALLYGERRALESYEKGVVVIAKTDIAKNIEIDETNYETYFTTMEIEKTKIPEAAYQTVPALNGTYTVGQIDTGAIITKSMVASIDTKMEEYSNSMLVTVSTSSLDQSVAGTLRAGDVIDIYIIEKGGNGEEEVTAKIINKAVVINRSYDASGIAIKKDDTITIAQIITIPMASEAVGDFLAGLEKGTVKFVKHLD